MSLEELGLLGNPRALLMLLVGFPMFTIGASYVWRGRRDPGLRGDRKHRIGERLLPASLPFLALAAYFALPFEGSNPERFRERQLVSTCEAGCRRQVRSASACESYCACAVAMVKRDPKVKELLQEAERNPAPESLARLNTLLAPCVVGQPGSH